jgi:phosphatidylserine/phosphatidylglycerophosphate/cardiolipin synthase-like enzyme
MLQSSIQASLGLLRLEPISRPGFKKAITGNGINARAMSELLEKDRNCCTISSAARGAVLIDAANYFLRLEELLSQARHSILIVGWDFDASICLHAAPGNPDEALGTFLRQLVEKNPQLEIRILVWSLSLLHAPGDPLPLLFGAPWQDHPRIHLRLDREHPFYACHHQKIVSIDDSAAFVGGIDLTVGRRDTPGHVANTQRRCNPDGKGYGPVHDVQMLVEGPAAQAVAAEARTRWLWATGERLGAQEPRAGLWPADLKPDFQNVPVAISRTAPSWRGRSAISEIAVLTTDMIRAARQNIYIEAQYFTADALFDLLVPILSQEQGPEIVLVLTAEWHGQIERFVLSRNRDRLLRRLGRADRYGRLKAYYPVVPAEQRPQPVLVHAKLMVVDGRLLRVGSSNLNNRSIGLDTECDLTIEARNDAECAAVARIRDRLLAEHLGTSREHVSQTFSRTGSLVSTIEALNKGPRRLEAFQISPDGPTTPVFGTSLIDPQQPFGFLQRVRPLAGRLGFGRAPEYQLRQ